MFFVYLLVSIEEGKRDQGGVKTSLNRMSLLTSFNNVQRFITWDFKS